MSCIGVNLRKWCLPQLCCCALWLLHLLQHRLAEVRESLPLAQPKTPLGASIQVDWGYFCGTQESRILVSRLCYVLRGITKDYDELLISVHLYWATCWHRIYWFRKLLENSRSSQRQQGH